MLGRGDQIDLCKDSSNHAGATIAESQNRLNVNPNHYRESHFLTTYFDLNPPAI